MGLFESVFGSKRRIKRLEQYWQTFNGYTPVFQSAGGEIYEMQQIRSAINARATHASKLSFEMKGEGKPKLRNRLKDAPNEWQTWGQFLARVSTILDVQNTAFIVPIFDQYGDVNGIYPVLPSRCEFREDSIGVPYIVYEFSNGKRGAIEMDLCGILNKFQYRDDLIGESNRALFPTMELISIQNQAIREGVKSAASYRFMGQFNNVAFDEDLRAKKKQFNADNFGEDSEGGLILFPKEINNPQQIKSTPFIVDAEQMKLISDHVNDYFGVNQDILQNKAYGDAWSAFYEGAVEWLAIQLSEVLTKMLFTSTERSFGNRIIFTSNRLQYMSNADKLNVTAQMADRGIFTVNEIREIWNLAPVDDGDVRLARGEYYNVAEEKEK